MELLQALPGKDLFLSGQLMDAAGHLQQAAFQVQAAGFGQVGLHALGKPFQQGRVLLREAVQQAVDAFLHQGLAVQLHLIGGELAHLAGESPEGLLEEAVDGGDGEGGIVVQDAGELPERPLPQFLHIPVHQGQQVLCVFGIRRIRRQGVQLLQDAAFHLVRGLVGEGDGQHMAIGIRFITANDKPDVFLRQMVCLAGPRRRLQNLEHSLTKISKKYDYLPW